MSGVDVKAQLIKQGSRLGYRLVENLRRKDSL